MSITSTDVCPYCRRAGRDGHSPTCPSFANNSWTAPSAKVPDTGCYTALGRHFDVVAGRPDPVPAPEPPRSDDGITDDDLAGEMRAGMGLEPVLEPQILSTDSAERKRTPVYSGVVKYFPRALAYVAQISFAGNEKHNPGQPLHWSRDKSSDHLDCVARHLIDAGRVDPEDGLLHDGKLVWRALANLELKLESMEKK